MVLVGDISRRASEIALQDGIKPSGVAEGYYINVRAWTNQFLGWHEVVKLCLERMIESAYLKERRFSN